MKLFVYTFWEPRGNIPYYLRLCMETWKKFLPNATLIVLDYENIGEFIDIREFDLKLFSDRRFAFMHISDVIRVALLAKRGGIWLDADTIILNSNAEKYFLPDKKHRPAFFGRAGKGCYTAFINTPPATMCLNIWHEFNRERLWNLKPTTLVDGEFFSNNFINDYTINNPDELKIFDHKLVMPEISSGIISTKELYLDYYFLNNFHLSDVNSEMLLLHNSWTPSFFRQLSPKDFFSLDCTLVNILAEALEIPLRGSRKRIVVD